MSTLHTQAATHTQVLDWEGLKARCMNNADLIGRVLGKFTTQLDADLAALETAVAASDSSTVASLAHRIKGMSGSVKADSIHCTAATAEEEALRGELNKLANHLQQLRHDQKRVRELLGSVSGTTR